MAAEFGDDLGRQPGPVAGRVAEEVVHGGTVAGLLGEAAVHQLADGPGQPVEVGGLGRHAEQLGVDAALAAAERGAAGRRVRQHGPQGEDVGRGGQRFAPDLLGRHVAG